MLTKEQLTDAYEQGLSISTRNGNIKIVTILGEVYGVNHCDTNSKLVKWWMFENFERNEAKIEQPKPKKYNGRAVKCDTLEQFKYIATRHKSQYIEYADNNFFERFNYYEYDTDTYRTEKQCIKAELEIISFSDYCKENNIVEPKWIQGFEVKDGYNDVVMVTDNKIGVNTSFPNVAMRLLKRVREHHYPFEMYDGSLFKYCRYPKRSEINEIKFVD